MAKLARILGHFDVVPTLGDDSGALHAICYCVNHEYRTAQTIRERCLIVHRFRSKLADRFSQGKFEVSNNHADEFELNLRAYDGKLDGEAIDFVSVCLKVNIVLLHLLEERMLRRGTKATFDETIVVGWNGDNWCALNFNGSTIIHTPDADHVLLEQGV